MASSQVTGRAVPQAITAASVKVCGVRTVEHALAAVDAGAEFIGMIFAPTRRQVSTRTARAMSDAVHAAKPDVRLVGVFVNASPTEVNAIARAAGLDMVQLHGDETPDEIARIERDVIKAIRALPAEDAATLAGRIERYLSTPVPPVAVLLDGFDPNAHGGTGVRADWGLVREVAQRLDRPVGLAGGLTPANVGGAIEVVRPLFVDASSGVERDGIKDVDLIGAFIRQADRAFGRSSTR